MKNTFKYLLVISFSALLTFFLVKSLFQYLNTEIVGMPVWLTTYFYDSKTVLLPLSYLAVFVAILWATLSRLK